MIEMAAPWFRSQTPSTFTSLYHSASATSDQTGWGLGKRQLRNGSPLASDHHPAFHPLQYFSHFVYNCCHSDQLQSDKSWVGAEKRLQVVQKRLLFLVQALRWALTSTLSQHLRFASNPAMTQYKQSSSKHQYSLGPRPKSTPARITSRTGVGLGLRRRLAPILYCYYYIKRLSITTSGFSIKSKVAL